MLQFKNLILHMKLLKSTEKGKNSLSLSLIITLEDLKRGTFKTVHYCQYNLYGLFKITWTAYIWVLCQSQSYSLYKKYKNSKIIQAPDSKIPITAINI